MEPVYSRTYISCIKGSDQAAPGPENLGSLQRGHPADLSTLLAAMQEHRSASCQSGSPGKVSGNRPNSPTLALNELEMTLEWKGEGTPILLDFSCYDKMPVVFS